MSDNTTFHSRFAADILYGMMPMPRTSGFKMTTPIKDVEPERRRVYMRRLYRWKNYRNGSRKFKTAARRIALRVEVPSV